MLLHSLDEVANMHRHRVGISKLLEEKFGWTCQADQIMEQALEEQQEALHSEREAVKYAQSASARDEGEPSALNATNLRG